jgi:hypothetical protein
MKRAFLLVLIAIGAHLATFSNTVDSLLVVLDQSIRQSSEYQNDRENRIGGLKSLLVQTPNEPDQRYLIYSKLVHEYRPFIFDSALHYLYAKTELAQKLNRADWTAESNVQKLGLLSATGMYKEAFDVLEQIERSQIKPSVLPDFYANMANLYSQMAFYTHVGSMVPQYYGLVSQYRDSVLQVLQYQDRLAREIQELVFYSRNELDQSLKMSKELLAETQQNDPKYALYAYRVACNYRDQGNVEKEKEYLIRSAIADIQNGIKDNASLTMLAMIFYREKQIARAYDYIQFSLADAAFFKAPLRYIELSNVLPVINDAYHLRLEKQKRTLEHYLLLISFLAVFLISSLVFIVMQFRNLGNVRTDLQVANQKLNQLNAELSGANEQLNGLNNQLVESNLIKEQYIGHFLNRCSNYIEKLENYQKQVHKQVVARKFTELFESTKSNQLIDAELAEFYETFDQTFLILFPNFVEQINSLFNDEDRFELRKGELLNTELRIFALIRLGITDSSKIASLLRYSVNTIYNYRVKVKNKCNIPRDEFEERVKRIGNFNRNGE